MLPTCWSAYKNAVRVQNAPVHVIEEILSASMHAHAMLVNINIILKIRVENISVWTFFSSFLQIARLAVTIAKIQFAPGSWHLSFIT